MQLARHRPLVLCALALVAAGCGGSGGGDGGAPPAEPVPACADSFEGTFEAIQAVVFERQGCTQAVCHGDAAQGGLDLRAGSAYASLIETPSLGSELARVVPGSPDRSYLFRKLSAATVPGSYTVAGSPMPSGLPPISADLLEGIRLWIKAGAPETGAVAHPDDGTSASVGALFDACLPPAAPITIKPLDPPPAGEGVQFVMPSYVVPATGEVETCFAAYYDFTGRVPDEYLSEDGTRLRYAAQEMRQDALSHHLVLDVSGVALDQIHHPSFGEWTCKGGARAGAACEPTDASACGDDGVCGATPVATAGCVGYGPDSHFLTMGTQGVGGGMTTQLFERFPDGVYNEIPLRGIWYWNSHAFNLTLEDHPLNARINFLFARQQRHLVERIPVAIRVLYAAAGTPPYESRTVCADYTLPQRARLIELTSHTHKRGKHFTVDAPDGSRIYESLRYGDPLYQPFEPALAFDDADPATRTLHYCSRYDNGVAADGSPDPSTVTRASRMPDRTSCVPIACTAGKIGASCAGVDDDATCDSTPGAGDGECDACAITAGNTTENEMFILLGWYYLD
jgi:hypothetical protein